MDEVRKNHLRRFLFNALCAISAVALLASVSMDVRSHWTADDLLVRPFGDRHYWVMLAKSRCGACTFIPVANMRDFFTGSARIILQHSPPESIGFDFFEFSSGRHLWQWLGMSLEYGAAEPFCKSCAVAIFPLWIVELLTAVLPALWLTQLRRRFRQRRTKAGLCPRCGYDIRANPQRCSECGFELGRRCVPRVKNPI